MNVPTAFEAQSKVGVSLEEAIQQLINLGANDPLEIARQIEQRYEEEWLRDELYALRQDVISDIARQRINGMRRSAMSALRKGKQPPRELMLLGEWIPNHKGGGGWKKLGEWTSADLRSRENYYRKMSGTASRLADWCHTCAELMETEKVRTLGKVKASLPTLNGAEHNILENGKTLETVVS